MNDIALLILAAIPVVILLGLCILWLYRRRLRLNAKKLAASEEKYRRLVENSSDGVLLVQDDRALYTNSRAVDILGFTPEKLADISISELFKNGVDTMPVSQSEDDTRTPLYRIQRPDGKTRWVRVTRMPIEWENNPAIMVVVADETSHIQAERALQETEKKLATALLTIPDAIAITRLTDGQFIEVNENFERLSGYSAAELSGRTSLELGLWAQVDERDWLMEQLRLNGQVVDMEMKVRIKNGEMRFGLASARLIELHGQACVLMIIRDISEKKSNEDRFRQQMQRLATLRVVDMTIAASMELDQVLNLLLEKLIRELDVDACVLLMLNSRKQLVHRANVGMPEACVSNVNIKLGENHAGWAALHMKPIYVLHAEETPDALLGRKEFADAGFIAYYCTPLIAKGRVLGVLEIFNRRPLPSDPEWLNFFEALADQAAIAIENASLMDTVEQANQEMLAAYDDTIQGWAHALELRDGETEGHSQRVLQMTLAIARSMGFDDAQLVHMKRGALLHDIGKMAIPDAILFKPGPLTADEWEIMRKHPMLAYRLLAGISFLCPALDIPYCHHERWNGSGYPRGLAGEEIPLAARIFAVVDVWDALLSDRPYRNAWDEQQAADYLRQNAGILFDPAVVAAFFDQFTVIDSPDKFRSTGSNRQPID